MPQQSPRWSVKGSSLRFKISLAVTIPMAVAAILGALQVRDDLSQAIQHSDNAQQVTVLGPAVDYLRAAEEATVAAHKSSEKAAKKLSTSIATLQSAGDDLLITANAAHLTPAQARQVVTVLDLSRAMREEGDTLSRDTWVAQLRQLQSGVSRLVSTVADAQPVPEPRLELLSQALAGRFSLAMQQALAAGSSGDQATRLELFSELGVESAAIDRLAGELGESEPAVLTLRSDNSERFRAARTGHEAATGQKAFTPYDTVMTGLQQGIDEQLTTAADERQSSALRNAITTLAIFLGALVLALLVSQLLLDPIRRVREGARKVAQEDLPRAVAQIRAGDGPGEFVPIDVATTEEIGQLARAVDDLHRQAITLASSEAQARDQVDEMFVTLSRRSTSLVNQQLALIEDLEKDEEDPRRLDSLFRLDHLASRMRRTADSLLILGNAPSRPGDQSQLTVTETLQAATAGVLDYQRVRVDAAVGQRVAPGAVADVVHLLTELVDNALAYSPPTTQVELNAFDRTSGVDIEVVDAGLGIAPVELISLNQTLTSGEGVSSDTARRMGLFVVSRLAARHGISVHLSRNPSGGTTARVHLPGALLREPVARVAPDPVAAPAGAGGPSVPSARVPDRAPAEPAGTAARTSLPSRGDAAAASAGAGLPQRRPGASADLPGLPPQTAVPAPAQVAVPAPAPTPVPAPAPIGSTAPDQARPPLSTEQATIAEMSNLRRRVRHVEASAATVAAPTGHLDRSQAVIGSSRSREPAAPQVEEETPMFRNLTSSWFEGNRAEAAWTASEVEQGWERADAVARPTPEAAGLTETGLPVRRPGARLVPGSVTQQSAAPAVDPEQVRARLSAHAAGVQRGRRVAASTTENDQHPAQEAGPE